MHQVLAAHRPAPHLEAEGAAEDSAQQVLDRAETGTARRETALSQAILAVSVVDLALLGIGEDLVGLGRCLELLLGVGIVSVDIGMQLAGDLAEGPLDLRV